MPEIDELLNSEMERMESESMVNEEIVVNPITRMMDVPISERLFGVVEDANVEKKYFRCPRYVGDNIDLSKLKIYMKYVHAVGNTPEEWEDTIPQFTLCDDVKVDGNDIVWTWKLSANVFTKKGFIAFAMVAKDENTVAFNTYPAIGTVLTTIPYGSEEISMMYPDIVTQLLRRMDSVEAIATPEAMQNYVNTYLNENPVQLDKTLTDKTKAAPANIVGELKEDLESIEPTQINQNFVENILNGVVLHERSSYNTNSGDDKETAVNNISSSEYCYCYEPIRVRKDSGTLLFNNLVISKVISQDVPIGMCWGKDGSFKHRLVGNNNSYSDGNFQHIGVQSGENIHLDIPEDTYYIGFIQWYQTVDNPSDFTVKQSKIELKWLDTGITKNNIVTVKADGTGDFDSIINAVNSIKNASETNRYTVYIYQGEYDIFNELGGKAFFSTITNEKDYRECGINLKPYVSLVGIGSPVLKLLPDVDSISNIAVEKTSVINCYGTNDIININIQCKNCRYGIHDESGGDSEYYYHERNIKNCKIIHYGNDYSFSFQQTNPYACGFDVGNTINIENCDFIACSWGNAVSFHDRLSNTVDTQIAIKYCNLSTLGDETLRFGSVGRDNHHKVNIVGCNLSDNIMLNEETSNSGVGCSFELYGHGNNKVVHKIVSTKENDNELHYPMFSEEKSIICCRNEKIKLLKGVAYTYDRKGSAYVSEANGNVFNFIPLEDIPAYGKGLVFKCGYIKNDFLKIGKTEIGDKISFVNGIFKVGEENVIGEDDGRVDGYVLIN